MELGGGEGEAEKEEKEKGEGEEKEKGEEGGGIAAARSEGAGDATGVAGTAESANSSPFSRKNPSNFSSSAHLRAGSSRGGGGGGLRRRHIRSDHRLASRASKYSW